MRRVGNQLDPHKIGELLPQRETEYWLVPGPLDTLWQRRAALAAKMLLPKGARLENVRRVLTELLGGLLINYRVTKPGERVTVPGTPDAAHGTNFQAPGAAPKFARLLGEGLIVRLGKVNEDLLPQSGHTLSQEQDGILNLWTCFYVMR